MEAEGAVVGLSQTAIVNVHLIGCAANHLTLPHQGLVGQQLWPCASVPHDHQRLLLRQIHFSHLEGKRENNDMHILVADSHK